MNKRFRGILAAIVAITMAGVLAWPIVMAAQTRESGQPGYYYFFQIVNENDQPFTDAGFVNCSIYRYGANGSINTIVHSAASLANGTGLAGPLYSNSNGIIHWYSGTTTPVDVVCFTKGGDSGRKVRMAITDHRLRISTTGAQKVVRFPFSTNTGVTATGLYIPQGAVVQSVAVNVATPGATVGHIDVGFGGNHAFAVRNALADRLQLGPNTTTAAAGFNTFLDPTGTVGATWPGIGGVQSVPRTHMGVLLKHINIATGGANSGTYNGGVMVHTTGGLELTYDTSNVGSMGGHVYVFFQLIHVGSTVHGPGY